MSALDRFALVAAAAGTAVAQAHSLSAEWGRYRDPKTGLSFETPFEMEPEPCQGPFEAMAAGRMTLPYVFDVTYMATRETPDESPKTLAHGMATQWMVDYDLTVGPSVRRVDCPGVDEAWSVYAEFEDDAGTIGYAWLTLRKGDRIGCLGVSCWTAEKLGREALYRTLDSVSGD